ncbi:hypothetical protein PVK06_036899 [Gossypium arboreum]|uniref:Uncharacterized protein n=1 Tax=Gossypium arboreum TaxID=29729 RepID=A0ABR0NKR9_GOSAR|nr:hypothetical protein PVK06_036899 [Gossypium arboreum]
MKLNAFKAGGVIRDGKGNWILGYNRFLGSVQLRLLSFEAYWMVYFYSRNKDMMRPSFSQII